MLVDDKPENLIALKAILRDPGYQLVTASSGAEALNIVLRQPVAMVLLDVVMLEMDGFEVARSLKTLERAREIPILFLTALATDVQQIYRAYEVGAVDYIIKPLDAAVVRSKVAVFADIVRQREQIALQAQALREADRRDYELRLAELRVAGDRRYRKLVEGIDHAIGWTMDESLRLTFVSRQATRILGFSAEQLAEPGFWAAHLPPEDRATVVPLFRKALAEGTEVVVNHRMVATDGRVLWFHSGVSGEPPTQQEAAELHGISVEVTDLKRAEEKAQLATHLREELMAIVAHDLRNPLSAIRMGAGLLARVAERITEVPVQETAQTILRSADRMDRLINDLLDFALIQAGHISVEPAVVEADGLIEESLETFRALAKEKQVKIIGGGARGLSLYVDRDRLLQVISNLLGNAIKFTPENGSVELRVQRDDRFALFSITDTGLGMSGDELTQIWGRYWQANKSPEKGVGLGLFIAKGLIEAHGGRIWAESKPGAGATFFFTIPLASGAASASGAPPGP